MFLLFSSNKNTLPSYMYPVVPSSIYIISRARVIAIGSDATHKDSS